MTTTALDVTRTLGDLVSENPARATVLDRLGLDFCCHGQRSLTDACDSAGLELGPVVSALDEVADVVPQGWTGGGRASLAGYVEDTHHAYLHAELPALRALAAKVANVHGAHHPELVEVRAVVDEIVDDLVPHLATEEDVVFPVIAGLGDGTAGDGRLATQIAALEDEHAALGELLARLREVTGGYVVPADGCASYHNLYERLAALEADTHIHIHLENNVLFPAALVEAN